MKKFASIVGYAAISSMLVASAALADGAPRHSVKDAPAPAAFSWKGFYVGGHIGIADGNDRITDVNGYYAPLLQWQNSGRDTTNLFGGAQLGYNHQLHGVVVGVEVDLGFMGVDQGTQSPEAVQQRRPIDDGYARLETGFYGAVSARAGISLIDPRLLAYGKVGWGFVDVDASYIDNAGNGRLVSGTAKSEFLNGLVYGAGVEFALTDKISIKTEYLRFDLGNVSLNAMDNRGRNWAFKHDVSIDTVKVGVNYRF